MSDDGPDELGAPQALALSRAQEPDVVRGFTAGLLRRPGVKGRHRLVGAEHGVLVVDLEMAAKHEIRVENGNLRS